GTPAEIQNRKPFAFPDGTPTEQWRVMPGGKDYQYVQAVLFQPRCMGCHSALPTIDNGQGLFALPKQYQLAEVIVIKTPMERVKKAINRNRAILISTALVTAILAMLTSWTIFRYVVAKPVGHLRDVSDAIAAGRLNIRSQIHTGDEFEELSHAFNRMLHN